MEERGGSTEATPSSTASATTSPNPGHKLAQIIRPRLRRPPKAEYHRHLSPSHDTNSLPGIHQLGVFGPPPPLPSVASETPEDDGMDELVESGGDDADTGMQYDPDGDEPTPEESSNVGVTPEELEQDGRPAKKRRRRQALSCTECKRRKIKCDRVQPCSPCARRGETSFCKWEILDPLDKPISRAQYDVVRTQLVRTEQALSHANAMNANLGLPPALTFPPIPPPPMLPMSHGPENSAQDSISTINHAPRHINVPNGYPLPPPPPPLPPHMPIGRFHLPYSHPAYPPSLPRPVWEHPGAHLPRPPDSVAREAERQAEDLNELQTRTLFEGFLASDEPRSSNTSAEGISEVYSSLPNKATSDALVELFFSRVHWNFCILHRPSFDTVYDAFWSMPSQDDRTKRVKTQWMALFWSMLCLALQSTSWRECVEKRVCKDLAGWRALSIQCWTLAHAALRKADFLNSRALEVVQALVLLCYCDHVPSARRFDSSHTLSITIRLAMDMGLNKLGTDEGHTVSGGVLRREIGRRVWWNIVYLDWYHSIDRKGTYFINPRQFNTAEPSSLPLEDMGKLVKLSAPESANLRTDTSFLLAKIRMARAIREYVDRENSSDPETDLLTVGERLFDEVVNSVPKYLVRHNIVIEAQDRVAKWERIAFSLRVQNGALSMHRKALLDDMCNRERGRSMGVCVKASREILTTFEDENSSEFPACLWWTCIVCCYRAAIVLLLEAFYYEDGRSEVLLPGFVLPVIGTLESVADVNDVAGLALTVLRVLWKELTLRSDSSASPAEVNLARQSMTDDTHDLPIAVDLRSAAPAGSATTANGNTLGLPLIHDSSPSVDIKGWLTAALLGRLPSDTSSSNASSALHARTRMFWDIVLRLDMRSFGWSPENGEDMLCMEGDDPTGRSHS